MPHVKLTMPVELPEPETLDVEALVNACLTGVHDLVVVLGPTAERRVTPWLWPER